MGMILVTMVVTQRTCNLKKLKVSYRWLERFESHSHVHHAAQPKKLCHTYAMHDVTAMFNSDEDQDGPGGTDTDAEHEESEESEGEEPEDIVLMLSDEVSGSTGLLKLILLIPSFGRCLCLWPSSLFNHVATPSLPESGNKL